MWSLSPKLLLRPAAVSAHVFLYGLAFLIPVVLGLQAFRVDGRFSLQLWGEMALHLDRWWVLLQNTLIVAVVAVTIAVAAGSALAVLAFKTEWRGRNLMVLLIVFLVCVPVYVSTAAIFSIVGVSGFTQPAAAAGAIYGLVHIPLAALLVGLGLVTVERELEEAALLDGSSWAVVMRISIGRAAWSVAAACVIIAWLVMTDYSITDIVGARTFAEEVYTQYSLYGQRAMPIVLSIPVMVMMGAALMLLHRRAGVLSRPLFQGVSAPGLRVPLRGWSRAGALLALLALLMASGWPAFMLLQRIESWPRLWMTVQSIAPDWATTVWIAGATGVLCGGASVSVAWLLSRSRGWQTVSKLLVLSLLSIPAPALAMTLAWVVHRQEPDWLIRRLMPLYDSLWIDVVALVLRFLPVAVLIVLPAVRRLPYEVDEAARCDGAGWFERLIAIYWPQCGQHALWGGLVVLILALGELDCVHILSPPGVETLSKRFFSFVHSGIDAQVASVCLAAIMTALVPAALLYRRISARL